MAESRGSQGSLGASAGTDHSAAQPHLVPAHVEQATVDESILSLFDRATSCDPLPINLAQEASLYGHPERRPSEMDNADLIEGWKRDRLRQSVSSHESDPEHFFRCWQHSVCNQCLDEPECSWCPFVRAIQCEERQRPFCVGADWSCRLGRAFLIHIPCNSWHPRTTSASAPIGRSVGRCAASLSGARSPRSRR